MVAVIFRMVAVAVSGATALMGIVAAVGGLNNPVVIEDNAMRIQDVQLVVAAMNVDSTIAATLAGNQAVCALILNGRIAVAAIVFQPLAMRQFQCHNFCN